MIQPIICISQTAKFPLITELNGAKVVIWTLEQDKANSNLIERGFMYFKQTELLKADTADYLGALRIASQRLMNDSLQLKECHFQNINQKAATQTAIKAAEEWQVEAKKQKRLKIISIIVGGALIVLVAL